MSLYKQYTTDTNLEKTGVILQFGMNSKNKPMSIRIARSGGANTKFNKVMEAVMKPYRRQIQTETIDRDLLKKLLQEVFAKAVVLSWENLEDENDEPLEFTIENCIKLFEDLPDLFAEVQAQSDKVALFRLDLKETDAGN